MNTINIPKINVPKINVSVPNPKEIKIDTSGIEQAGKTVKAALEEGAAITDALRLSNYKMKTTLGRSLPKEDIPEVSKLTRKMYHAGNLTPEDINWCIKNRIYYK